MFVLYRLCPIPRARSRYVTLVQTVPSIIDTITTECRFVFRLPKILLYNLDEKRSEFTSSVSSSPSTRLVITCPSIDNVDNEPMSM